MAPSTEVWKPDGVIGWNERHADEECGSGEASREDQRRPVPRGQRSATRDVMVRSDARCNVHQGGDTQSRADLARGVDQPSGESLLTIGNAVAPCHGRSESGAAVPKPERRASHGTRR